MSIELKVASHGMLPGRQMVECWRNGVFVAAIYPHQDGIRIVSKYMTDVIKEEEPVYQVGQWLPSAIVKLEKKQGGNRGSQKWPKENDDRSVAPHFAKR